MRRWTLVVGFLLLFLIVRADIIEDVATALGTGNANQVSRHFDSNVELRILDETGSYSRTQAEHILDEFFRNHPVRSYQLKYKGNSNKGCYYCVGDLHTSTGDYRTIYHIRDVSGKLCIQRLNIEKP